MTKECQERTQFLRITTNDKRAKRKKNEGVRIEEDVSTTETKKKERSKQRALEV